MSIEEELDEICNFPEEQVRKFIHSEKISALSVMAVGIVHDLRGLLTPIGASIEIAIASIQENKYEDAIKYLRMADDAKQKLEDLTTRLLHFAKRDDYTRGTVYVNDVLNSVIPICMPEYLHQRITLETDFKELPEIEGYHVGLESVFSNMLLNALQAYQGVPEERDKKVYVRSYHKEGHIHVEIEDNGCGIKTQDLPHIFKYKYTTKKDGNGIGLTAASMIVEKSHFGKICIDTKYGEGTKFKIKLPDAKSLKKMREDTWRIKI